MIFVDRTLATVPASLTQKGGRARTETLRAILLYRLAANANQTLNFSAYKAADVKKQIKKLFNGKCAYCEARLVTVTTGDIEHFRPKGGYGPDGQVVKPGYYWLAAKWENLLLSCSNCNRKNTFELVGIGEKVTGKMNQFPLSDDQFRLKTPTCDFAAEERVRYLIDPCAEDPILFLYFKPNGLIKSKKINRIENPKGAHTIDICALQRKDLVDDRALLITKIKAQMKSVQNCITLQSNLGIGTNQLVDNMVHQEVTKLKAFLDPNEPFLSVARQFIGPFLFKVIGIRV
ncbi:uncharacterized protein (TIGR02646 family) [Mucilaginibacter sp. SG538B]|uniref:retron system putative HNH endonuclease n=1 Tax=Mucilaginibacter sp. SG538B TaxID=2587021 RepID=UPI00159D18AF|nr:retron system putative HNH endonuclease [Mucilaginibacter sp. SG538B]NVM66611.1 uncharacterized protein (TIGR02646 family) [Mucilaginibacter sp. SG538B]